MTIAAGGPVVSGQRYTISDVAGHTPGVSVTLSLCDRDSPGTGRTGPGHRADRRVGAHRMRIDRPGPVGHAAGWSPPLVPERAASPMSCNAFRPTSPRSTVTWCSGLGATRIGGSRSRTASPGVWPGRRRVAGQRS